MAKKNNTTTQAQFETTADGRRKLDKCYSGQKQMLAEGWTQEQIDALIDAPRSAPDTENPDEWLPIAGDKYGNVTMPEGAKWVFPKVDGFALCGTSLLTESEKARYRAYVKARESGQVKSTRSAPKQSKDLPKWQALLARVTEIGDEEAIRMVKELMPSVKLCSAYKKLTGLDTLDTTNIWTFYGFMYRGPNDEVKTTLYAKDLPELLEAGWQPTLLQKQVRALLDECKTHGITFDEDKNGVKFTGVKETVAEATAEAPAEAETDPVAEALKD